MFRIDFKRPKWAKRLEMIMTTVKEKLDALEAGLAPMQTALEGISGDLQALAAKEEANAAEIAALKAAVEAAQGGNLSAEDLARFDALIQSVNDASAMAKELDERLPTAPVAIDTGATTQ
jgi:hypothetical protein